VADFVRQQLVWDHEYEDILQSICDEQEDKEFKLRPYSHFLSCSGLDFTVKRDDALENAIDNDLLTHSLFDLVLGHRAKSFALSHYIDIHMARLKILSFLTKHQHKLSPKANINDIWWDQVSPHLMAPQEWISVELREDGAFLTLFESWLHDSNSLQAWLSNFEAETALVNNPEAENRVFSASTAMAALEWAKVGQLEVGQMKFNI
jgi:hypothetical protein